jgi:hypothetical protein
MGQSIDITGMKFARLTAIRMTQRGSKGPPQRAERWLFRCDCGNEVEAAKGSVTSGASRSCGCLSAEITAQRNKQSATHGHSRSRDGKPSPEYTSWRAMHKRCSDPNNKDWARYGARGISVCERWNSFEAFLADNGPRPSLKHELDRIDPNGNYQPGNTRWALEDVQANNRRNSRFLTINGRRQTLAQWGREGHVDPDILRRRVEAGWHPELIGRLIRIRQEKFAATNNQGEHR